MFLKIFYKFKIFNAIFFIIFTRFCETRILKRCELAREMSRLGTAKIDLPTWCCIAQFESKFNTSAVGQLNGNWSNDYGLFQVSDRYWCKSRDSRPSANLCQVDCNTLLSDNIEEAVKCAHYVKKRQGWKAWAAYNGRCNKMNSLPSIDECF